MSYILEALKKAEKERGRAPKTQALPPFVTDVQKKRKTPSWIFLLLAAAGIGTALLAVWSPPWKSQGPSSSAQGDVRPQPAPEEMPAATHRQGREDSMGAPTETAAHEPATEPHPLGIPAVPSSLDRNPAPLRPLEERSPPRKAQPLHELPPSVQGSIPEITISAHYYDSDPASRVATVNGRVMHEGQIVSPGLTIERITPSGVVFGYQGYLFWKEVF
jgi:hypothetical protein